MFSGPPLPLPHDFPLSQLVPLINSGTNAGVWLRDLPRQQRLTITAAGRCIDVLIGGDLGALLRCCSRVVVRADSLPLVLEADALIRWRALQVVTGTPYLPCPELLKKIFPDADIDSAGFRIPTQSRPPEEVLADCMTHGVPVTGSRIVYSLPSALS